MSSEFAFGSVGNILDERCLSLKSDMVEILTLVNDWELADPQAQEAALNSVEVIDYFENLLSTRTLHNRAVIESCILESQFYFNNMR